MAEGVQVDFELVLVEQPVVPGRAAAALHRPEVLRPARAPSVLLEPLLFRTPVDK